jgi:hypothetical protein
MIKQEKAEEQRRLASLLKASGISGGYGEMNIAGALLGLEGYNLSDADLQRVKPLKDMLLQEFGGVLGGEAIRGLGAANDFISQAGRLTRINDADTLVGAKPGGPIAKALSGGGTKVINQNFYGEGARVAHMVDRTLREGWGAA